MNTELDNIIREVKHLLQIVETVQNDPCWQDLTGVVFIDGIDDNGVIHAFDSNRVCVTVMHYYDERRFIDGLAKYSMLGVKFKMVQSGNDYTWVASTYESFDCKREYLMQEIYRMIETEFPNVRFELHGSYIFAENMMKNGIDNN